MFTKELGIAEEELKAEKKILIEMFAKY